MKARFAVLVLCLIGIVIGCVGLLQQPAAVADTVVRNTDYFALYAPSKYVSAQDYYSADIDKAYSEFLEEDCFRLVLTEGYSTYNTVKYSDGDNYRESYVQTATAGNIGGAVCYFIKLRYNETYRFFLSNGNVAEDKTIDVDLSNFGFDFFAPQLESKNAPSGGNMSVIVNDRRSSGRHITARSGIKTMRIYTSSGYTYLNKTYISTDRVTETLIDVISERGDIYLYVEDYAGNTNTELLYGYGIAYNDYAEKMGYLDEYIARKDDNGVGLSEKILTALYNAKDAYNAYVVQHGTATPPDATLLATLTKAMGDARQAIYVDEEGTVLVNLDDNISFELADGLNVANRKASYYYKDIRYGEKAVLGIVKEIVKKEAFSDTKLLDEIGRDKVDEIWIYTVTLTVDGEEKDVSTFFNLYDYGYTENSGNIVGLYTEKVARDYQSAATWLRFACGSGEAVLLINKPEILPWWGWTLIGVGSASIIAGVATIAFIKLKRKKVKI